MKVASWMVSAFEFPVPGHQLVKLMNVMYNMIGCDLWTWPQIQGNKDQTYAFISQNNTFGVNDVYFLGCAYGLVEVREDTIVKLGPKTLYMEKTESIDASVIIKTNGISANKDLDRILGFGDNGYLEGFWVNGDPLRSSIVIVSGVRAKNYAAFSTGPGYASFVTCVNYFIDFPEDYKLVTDLPKHKAEGGKAAFYADGAHFLMTGSMLPRNVPGLARLITDADSIKSLKTRRAHATDAYLAECEAEWKMYDKMFRDNGQIPADAKFIPYPYTREVVDRFTEDIAVEFCTTNLGAPEKGRELAAALIAGKIVVNGEIVD
jgi:hypothetical protein